MLALVLLGAMSLAFLGDDIFVLIAAELDAIQTQLPDGMEVNPALFQQAGFIEVAVDNVVEALRDGAVLVVVVLFLFLWNVRTTFISVLAIPLSLAAANVLDHEARLEVEELAVQWQPTVVDVR